MSKKQTISVVMPIHNEEEYLPYSLPSLLKSRIDELVIVLDRCTDKSEEIIRKTVFPYPVKIIVKSEQKWKCPTAEVFEIGFSHATGDLFYSMAGDMVTDPSIYDSGFFNDADIIAFFYYSYDRRFSMLYQWYLNFLKKHFNIARLWKGKLAKQSGHMAFKREVWEQLHIEDSASEYDNLQKRALEARYTYKFVDNCRNFHLRAGIRKDRQTLQGISRAHRGTPWFMVLGHSIILLKPYVWVAYRMEKQHSIFKGRKWGKNGYES